MAEYIEREKIINGLELSIASWSRDFNSSAPIIANAYRDMLSRVKNYPAADVVEVVRCKECKYGDPYLGNIYCENQDAPWALNDFANIMSTEDYCSYGERRAEE